MIAIARYKESKPFYHSKAWKQVRQLALARDGGMCCQCMELFQRGLRRKPNRADMVHHIIPIDTRPDLALTLDNLQSLCNKCHNTSHPEKGWGDGGSSKAPFKHRMRVIKV